MINVKSNLNGIKHSYVLRTLGLFYQVKERVVIYSDTISYAFKSSNAGITVMCII